MVRALVRRSEQVERVIMAGAHEARIGGLRDGGVLRQAVRGIVAVYHFERSSHLLTSGVFAISRHPMYLGMVLILGGIAMLLGTLGPFVIVLAFAVWFGLRFVAFEERMLADTFGDG